MDAIQYWYDQYCNLKVSSKIIIVNYLTYIKKINLDLLIKYEWITLKCAL